MKPTPVAGYAGSHKVTPMVERALRSGAAGRTADKAVSRSTSRSGASRAQLEKAKDKARRQAILDLIYAQVILNEDTGIQAAADAIAPPMPPPLPMPMPPVPGPMPPPPGPGPMMGF